VLIWYAAMSVAIVWAVFQSPAIDYRMVMLGSIIPVLEDPFFVGPLHTMLVPTLVLVVVMLATIGRRLLRRRLLGIPIGMYLHLVLGGAWSNTEVFWWPVFGEAVDTSPPRSPLLLVLELIGIGVASWLWNRFGLSDPDRRRQFISTGQLDRVFVGGREADS
jgi:hypothetical protein